MELKHISLCFALLGILLVWASAPEKAYSQRTVSGLAEDCSGLVSIQGYVSNVFLSQSGSFGITIKEGNAVVLVLSKQLFSKSEKLMVYGSANLYGGSCWLFADRVEAFD